MTTSAISNKKVLLINTRSFCTFKFRKNLIKSLKDNGNKVVVFNMDDEYEKEITAWGVKCYCHKQNNRSVNPFEKLDLYFYIKKIVKEEKPDLAFTFQITANTFGALAAHSAGVKYIYSMVEGLGDVFVYNTLKWKLVRAISCFLMKKSFKNCRKVFFLNNDDSSEFLKRNLVKKEQIELIPNVGVDTKHFDYKPITNTKTFLMVSRMMPSKGTIDYCKLARMVKKDYPDTVFNYLGDEFTLTKEDIKEYLDDGSVNYLGFDLDVRPYIENSFVNILASYREGSSMVVAETLSIGRPVISFDITGIKNEIIDGYNGVIVKERDLNSLYKAVVDCIKKPDKYIEMGANARKFVLENLDAENINNNLLKTLKEDLSA